MPDDHPPVTWGDLKRWAQDNGVPDDAELVNSKFIKIRDLDHGEAEYDEPPYLQFKLRWGS